MEKKVQYNTLINSIFKIHENLLESKQMIKKERKNERKEERKKERESNLDIFLGPGVSCEGIGVDQLVSNSENFAGHHHNPGRSRKRNSVNRDVRHFAIFEIKF